jgi:hypothetical protein
MSTQTLINRYRLAHLRTADASPQRGGCGGEAINELLTTFMLARRALAALHKSHHDPTRTEKASSTMRVRPRSTFPTRLNSDGTMGWSTYLGGSSTDVGNGIAVDGDNNATAVGSTQSSNFPTRIRGQTPIQIGKPE